MRGDGVLAEGLTSFLAEILGAEAAEKWQGAGLEKMEVHRGEGLWRFYVTMPDLLPVETLQETERKLLGRLDFVQAVEIIPVPENSRDVLENIMNRVQDELSSFLFANPAMGKAVAWKADNNRLDMIASTLVYQYILENDICQQAAAWFWEHYRLTVLVRVLCTRCEAVQEPPELIMVSREQVDVLPADTEVQTWKKTNGRRDRKSKQSLLKGEPLPVAEIIEGLKNVIAEGEVWDKKYRLLHGGRMALEYHLTDYTGTIIVKSFLDHQEEDPVNIGDWVRVAGNVRFDDYCDEAVLFLEALSPAEKLVRRDENQDKRIELHAHTKMSAMDGLTEVHALVKKAAQWGHAAVAITDHGCTQAFPEAYAASKKNGIKIIYGVEAYLVEQDRKDRSYHIILLARDRQGLKNLYKLVSLSYLEYFYFKPRIPRHELQKYRQGLLVGTACQAGELYQTILKGEEADQVEKTASFYDYLEIQPLQNNEFLVREGTLPDYDSLKDINTRIVELGKKMQIPVVATGDVHFLEPHDRIYRTIIQAGQGYQDAEAESALYFRTTQEMLQEFAYLGEADARAVVIENPAKINEMIDNLQPVPDGFYPPKIESAEQEITDLTWRRACDLYGPELPGLVRKRIEKELDSITRHGFSVLYLIAHKLVKKSNDDGYMVGSRGSVGSSLVAYLTGITEVNPLCPHYLCPECFYSEFLEESPVGCGADLPDRQCPHCSSTLHKEGFDIPFETFLGFEGDKVPDIDLNFSGEYQSRAHQYVEELFGSENVYRAGTISTIATKTAYGFVKNYSNERQLNLKNSEINRLVQGVAGVRKTTGQHPGGLIVVPKDKDILEFTPLQYPADKKSSGVITTHFEYHAVGDQLVKLDILGHDDPTVLKELEDLTGVRANSISLSEPTTMGIFSSVEPLGLKPEDINSSVGTLGVPEFGTRFVRQMLETTRPTTFSELVRISGLSHGTDVWLNNAQQIIESGTAPLGEVICTRDDIMIYLIQQGLDTRLAFKIMENVRKGKGLSVEQAQAMEEFSVPSWYIESCRKIKYMFPKAHAVAYVTMAYRIAYFKVFYPREFYASFFSIRAEDFDAETILRGSEAIRRRIGEIDRQGQKAQPKDKKLLVILEVAMEMLLRGFDFYPVDIDNSDSSRFKVYKNGLLLPFSALPNVGVAAAQGIVSARSEKPFLSIEDFQQRSHLNKTAMEILRKNDCFSSLPESTQISLFG